MSFNYIENIKCFSCGGTDLEQQHILNGFTRCSCTTCGNKFLVQCDGSDIVDRYVADRGRVSAIMEIAELDERELNEALSELKSLVKTYSAVADIDPIYHWFKIELLTNNFRDFKQYSEAEREYKKVSESYVISATDKTRTEAYERLYRDYCGKYEKLNNKAKSKKSKKKKIILSLCLVLVLGALVATFLTSYFYEPVLRNEDVGISVKLDNDSYGMFGKFSLTMTAENIGTNTSKHDVVDAAISDMVVRYEVFEFNLYRDGVVAEPKSEISVTIPMPDSYNKECIGVYHIINSESYEEIRDISLSSESVNFYADKTGLYAVAEKKIKVTFDSGIGDASEVQMIGWGERAVEPEVNPEKFGYIFDCWYRDSKAYNFSLAVDQDLYLTAHWVRDPAYNGYTYVSTADELKSISANTSGFYLLVNDIDLQGKEWKVISSFGGIFDGGYHSVYNFKITSAAYYASTEQVVGFFGKLLTGAEVKNLQIGKEGTTNLIDCQPWQQNIYAGAIAGYNAGSIVNCRAVRCSINLKASAQEEKYKDAEFASNIGGICGVSRGGTVSGCCVSKCNLTSNSESRYNNISNTARCGGIIGYSDNSTVSDCFIENNTITSTSKTLDVDAGLLYTNKSGQPYPVAGGVIGHAVSTTIMRVVVSGNTVTVNKSVGKNSNGNGEAFRGCMIGVTNSTAPSSLIGVNTTLNPSGSNASYPGFTKITENSFALLKKTDPGFDNGYWIENEGAIALNFKVEF